MEAWEKYSDLGLTKETFLALRQTCIAMSHLAKYLIEKLHFSYVLLRSVQSDALESRFGWYRQLSGGNYYLSVKQLLDNEKKIKALSLLKFSSFAAQDVKNLNFQLHVSVENEQIINKMSSSFIEKLQGQSDSVIDDSEAFLYYICGYIAKTRRKNCEDCAQYL